MKTDRLTLAILIIAALLLGSFIMGRQSRQEEGSTPVAEVPVEGDWGYVEGLTTVGGQGEQYIEEAPEPLPTSTLTTHQVFAGTDFPVVPAYPGAEVLWRENNKPDEYCQYVASDPIALQNCQDELGEFSDIKDMLLVVYHVPALPDPVRDYYIEQLNPEEWELLMDWTSLPDVQTVIWASYRHLETDSIVSLMISPEDPDLTPSVSNNPTILQIILVKE
ncbi:MAG: hypothetical protein AB1345_10745 [Chloroflexota bacterium]